MLAKRIIPCLDVNAGRVVKGVNFLALRDAGDPVEVARRYDEQGADEITFLDITATSDERDTILHIVEAVANQVFIPLTVGGGVRSIAALGMVDVLAREGLVPDLMVGCSAGALFGALIAAGHEAREAIRIATTLWSPEVTRKRRWRAVCGLCTAFDPAQMADQQN